MSDDVFNILKSLLSWASGIAVLLIGFGWNQNEKAHKALKDESEKAMTAAKEAAKLIQDTRQHTADGYSVLNDRMMTHLDAQMRELRAFVVTEDAKLMAETNTARGHIAKIFDKIEAQSQRSEDRHVETLNAIHQLASTMHTALSQKADK